ncbi:MAG: permease [Ignavibacteria bacterium]|nr:permease [Ignavibacteria bacterium]
MIDFFYQIWVVFAEMSPYLILGISFVAILDLLVSKKFIIKQVSKNNISSIIKTAIFGIPLPLCSCGVVPTSVYLKKSGASKPAVVSFLISTPQTGIDSIVATYGMLGPIFAIFRPIAAFIMGILGGLVTMFVEKNTGHNDNLKVEHHFSEIDLEREDLPFGKRLKKSLKYGFVEFIDDISIQFLIGLIVAGVIAYFVPNDFFASVFNNNEFLGAIAVILFAIPMYVCATASIPIAIMLMLKGFSPGIAYIFLVAGPVTNAASLAVLSKVLGKKLLAVYVSTVIILSLFFGMFLNWIFYATGIDPHTQMKHIHQHLHNASFSSWDYFFAFFFLILLLLSYSRKLYNKYKGYTMSLGSKEGKIYKIEGMTCNHCVMNVERAIRSVAGVSNVEINLSSGVAKVEGTFSEEEVKKAVETIGYKFIGEK